MRSGTPANCYRWVSDHVGPPDNVGRLVPFLVRSTGSGVTALDCFGQQWGGLINLLAFVLGLVSLWLSLR